MLTKLWSLFALSRLGYWHVVGHTMRGALYTFLTFMAIALGLLTILAIAPPQLVVAIIVPLVLAYYALKLVIRLLTGPFR